MAIFFICYFVCSIFYSFFLFSTKIAFSLVYFKYVSHICNAQHLKQATIIANSAVGIFYAYGFRYSSVPCGVLMHPQPVLGVEQRGAELFLFPSRLIIKLLFHLNCSTKWQKQEHWPSAICWRHSPRVPVYWALKIYLILSLFISNMFLIFAVLYIW